MPPEPPPQRFRDGKAPDAMRTIGEVCEALAIKPHVLRYWEEQFPMLRPLKRSGGRRLYRPEDVELVIRIDRLLNAEGYTIKGARKALARKGPAASPPAQPLAEAPDEPAWRSGMQAIRDRLGRALHGD